MIHSMNLNPVQTSEGVVQPVKPKAATPAESIKEFSTYLSDALNGVAALENNALQTNDQFIVGKVNADQMMITSEQALLSLQLTTQVRNKVIDAYQEIMRTQI